MYYDLVDIVLSENATAMLSGVSLNLAGNLFRTGAKIQGCSSSEMLISGSTVNNARFVESGVKILEVGIVDIQGFEIKNIPQADEYLMCKFWIVVILV